MHWPTAISSPLLVLIPTLITILNKAKKPNFQILIFQFKDAYLQSFRQHPGKLASAKPHSNSSDFYLTSRINDVSLQKRKKEKVGYSIFCDVFFKGFFYIINDNVVVLEYINHFSLKNLSHSRDSLLETNSVFGGLLKIYFDSNIH